MSDHRSDDLAALQRLRDFYADLGERRRFDDRYPKTRRNIVRAYIRRARIFFQRGIEDGIPLCCVLVFSLEPNGVVGKRRKSRSAITHRDPTRGIFIPCGIFHRARRQVA